MRFATDIIAINLREYSHSPQLLADLATHGYELFNPADYVFFRKYNALAPTPVQASAPADLPEMTRAAEEQ
jgi:hypothetical protein